MKNLAQQFQERNKKVAINRWQNSLSRQKNELPTTPESYYLRAMICGFLAGDGSVQVRAEKTITHYQIDFFPDDELMLQTYMDGINKIYNKSPSIRIEKRFFKVRVTSRLIVEDLLRYAQFGLKKWNMPNENLLSIPGAKEAWLRAFFSAEAYVGNDHIKVQTVNEKGMHLISKTLTELEILHHNYTYTPKKLNYSKVFIIMITSRLGLITYFKKIGFWHFRKTSKLREALGL